MPESFCQNSPCAIGLGHLITGNRGFLGPTATGARADPEGAKRLDKDFCLG